MTIARFGDDARAYARWSAKNPKGYVLVALSPEGTPQRHVLHRSTCKLIRKPNKDVGHSGAELVCAEYSSDAFGELDRLQAEWTECDSCLGLAEITTQIRSAVPARWSISITNRASATDPARIVVDRTDKRGRPESYDLEYYPDRHRLSITYGRRDCNAPSVWLSVQPALIVDLTGLRLFERFGTLSELFAVMTTSESLEGVGHLSHFPPNRLGPEWD